MGDEPTLGSDGRPPLLLPQRLASKKALVLEIQKEIGSRTEGLIFQTRLGHPWMYYTKDGVSINATARWMRKLREKYPGKYVFRDTRRGRFTQMTEKYGLAAAMALSAHKSTSVALRYNIVERQKLSNMVEETELKPKLQVVNGAPE